MRSKSRYITEIAPTPPPPPIAFKHKLSHFSGAYCPARWSIDNCNLHVAELHASSVRCLTQVADVYDPVNRRASYTRCTCICHKCLSAVLLKLSVGDDSPRSIQISLWIICDLRKSRATFCTLGE